MARKSSNEIEQKILQYIEREILTNGYPPSVREISAALDLKSTSTTHGYLQRMSAKGMLHKDSKKTRALRLNTPVSAGSVEYLEVPIIGKVTAGLPITAIENNLGTFPLPMTFAKNKDVFMLKIKGDSMVNAGILDGDYIIVNQQPDAANGDIVVALMEDEATCKTFYKEDGHFRLQPQNDLYDPIIVDELSIVGKVVGVFREI